MSLTIEEVRRIASLARLPLTAREEEMFGPQLAKIVAYIDQLGEFSTAEPEARGAAREADDVVAPSMPQELFLANAPEVLHSFLVVPQVKATDDE